MEWQDLCNKFDNLSQLDASARHKELKELSEKDPKAYQIITTAFKDELSLLDQPIFEQVTTSVREANSKLPDLEVGQVIGGEFELLAFLGQGATATVYRAFQKSLRREVAVKISRGEVREGQVLAKFDHPHILSVFSQHQFDNLALINLQYVEGCSLAEIIKLAKNSRDFPKFCKKAFSGDSSANPNCWVKFIYHLMTQTLKALSHAHEQGVLHLDIKPSNILIRKDGAVFLADFGVSLNLVRSQQETMIGGTYKYMAPEQEAALFSKGNGSVDETTDLFAISKVFGEVFAAFNKFSINSPQRDLLDNAQRLIQLNLNSEQSGRLQSAEEFLEEVEAMEFNVAFHQQVGAVGLLRKWVLRQPMVMLIVISILPQICGSIFNIFYNKSQIVDTLGHAQTALYWEVTLYYNLFFYPTGLGFFIWSSWRLLRFLQTCPDLSQISLSLDTEARAQLRSQLLNLPRHLLEATAIGWLPGMIIYPWTLQLSGEQQIHTIFSLFISWLIASCFSYIFIQFLCLGVFYPYFLSGHDNPHSTAQTELVPRLKNQFAFLLAGTLPLLAGITFIHWAEDLNTSLIRFLISYIIVLGMVGMTVGVLVGQSLNRLKGLIFASESGN